MKLSSARARPAIAALLLAASANCGFAEVTIESINAEIEKLERQKLELKRKQLEQELAKIAKELKADGKNCATPCKCTTCAQPSDKELSAIPKATFSIPAYFHTGFRLVGPNQIAIETTGGTTTATLKRGSSKAAIYGEFVYSNRWAWNGVRIEDWYKSGPGKKARSGDSLYDFFPADFRPDFAMRAGFTAAEGTEQTASAVLGAGDFDVEATLGMPVYGFVVPNLEGRPYFAGAVSLDASLGLSTDRKLSNVYERLLVGPALTISWLAQDEAAAYLQFRGGWAGVDVAKFKDATTDEISLGRNNLPEFHRRDGWALEADLYYPISKKTGDGAVVLGGRIYAGIEPATWTTYAGYSISVDKIWKSISGVLPGGADKEGNKGEGTGTSGDSGSDSNTRTPQRVNALNAL